MYSDNSDNPFRPGFISKSFAPSFYWHWASKKMLHQTLGLSFPSHLTVLFKHTGTGKDFIVWLKYCVQIMMGAKLAWNVSAAVADVGDNKWLVCQVAGLSHTWCCAGPGPNQVIKPYEIQDHRYETMRPNFQWFCDRDPIELSTKYWAMFLLKTPTSARTLQNLSRLYAKQATHSRLKCRPPMLFNSRKLGHLLCCL